jgi:NAD(P)-dependent dehydrogenase (short-subunit alcohol dehydrogenase family)
MKAAALFDLSDKTALITGASSGLGAHFASVLSNAGAKVILTARRPDALEAVASGLRDKGADVKVFALDVTKSSSVAGLSNLAAEVDILINNAGVTRSAPALDVTEDDWDAVVNTNLKGMFLVAQTIARGMRATKKPGSIVNIASILGLRQAGMVLPYAVSKAGVIQMTKTMALELARFNIRVNALAPGYIDTELNNDFWATEAGQALIREVTELDGPLLLLASTASSFMTGAVLAVDGGHLVSTL